MGKKIQPVMRVKCTDCNGTGKVEISSLGYLRKKAGLEQTDVAEALGLSRTSISNIERGVQIVTLDKVKPLAELYGVDEYEMYEIAKALCNAPPNAKISENDL